MVFEKKNEAEREFFSVAQRETVLEGISDLERASCADTCFFLYSLLAALIPGHMGPPVS